MSSATPQGGLPADPVTTSITPATAGTEACRPRQSVGSRARALFATVPLVLVSTLAMTLNIAAPADAATPVKRPAKAKASTPARALAQGTNAHDAVRAAAAPSRYVVVQGDTVSGIAGRFGLSTASVLALNGLGWSATIFPGQVLTLSAAGGHSAPAPARPVASELARYKVVSGDTISGIAAAHGLSTKALLKANGLGLSSVIFPGQSIVLPLPGHAASSPTATPAPPAAPHSAGRTHTIKRGDTISGVAAASGVSVKAILAANGLGWSSIIYPGQVLTIPGSAPASSPASTTTTPVAPAPSRPASAHLTDEMRRNARTIISVGRDLGVSDYGIVIALAAAAQESGLRNVRYGDRDSLGLFQQRPSIGWGTVDQVLDPVRASRAFFGGPRNPNKGVTAGLLDIRNWHRLTVTQAAQAVQVSAYPQHYAKWEAPARSWLAELG